MLEPDLSPDILLRVLDWAEQMIHATNQARTVQAEHVSGLQHRLESWWKSIPAGP